MSLIQRLLRASGAPAAPSAGLEPYAEPAHLPARGSDSFGAPAHEVNAERGLREVLIESRQRWRDLVEMAVDIAFEIDADGRFAFIAPENALGWPTASLIGQVAEKIMLPEGEAAVGFNPFRPTGAVRRRRGWLKRADGTLACLTFAAAPLVDAQGRPRGARGVGQDTTIQESHDSAVAAALRRGEVLDHILWHVRQEVLAPRMMASTLDALVRAMGAEGAAVVDARASGDAMRLLHEAGEGGQSILECCARALRDETRSVICEIAADGRPVLVCPSYTRFGDRAALALWRPPGSRDWDGEDHLLASSATGLIRMILEHESVQREMVRQARTDPLTGLANRRAFVEEMARRIERLDREALPGTLLFIDLDNFKRLNDVVGHDAGDEALRVTASLLRATFRPTDLIARLGGDEFAVWLDNADQFVAAERSEQLCREAPRHFSLTAPDRDEPVTLSIGIATRRPCGDEEIESLMRRADLAMYEVKRMGRGHWRVSQGELA